MNKIIFCIVCKNSKIYPYLDLGLQPRANSFLKNNKNCYEEYYNLVIGRCKLCGISQLLFHPKKEKIFREDYSYFTGVNQPMIKHFREISDEIKQNFLDKDDLVVEIGSNDGTFLENFYDYKHVGVEPSKSVAIEAQKKNINTIINFFNKSTAEKIIHRYKKATIIFAANVIGHVEEIDIFFQGVKNLLSENGIFIFEIYYLPKLIKDRRFDLIYDEHLYYYSVISLIKLLRLYELNLFKIDEIPVHGGSIRGYASHISFKENFNNTEEYVKFENNDFKLFSNETYIEFNLDVNNIKNELKKLILEITKNNKIICGFGATAKSTTILNYLGKESKKIKCIYDNTPIKQNTYTPGSHIPVKNESKFLSDFPDYTILFAWNYEKDIRNKYYKYEVNGGKWIILHPTVKILN